MYRDRIKQVYEYLSPSYRKVADFLMDSYREAAFVNASGLARRLDVDPATVVRFSQRLGYPGYPGLAAELRAIVRDELLSSRMVPAMPEQVPTIHGRIGQDIGDLKDLLMRNPQEVLDKVAGLLTGVRRVFVISEGDYSHLAECFVAQLCFLGRTAVVVPADTAGNAEILAEIGTDDVVLGLGNSRYATDVAAFLSMAKDQGAETICLAERLTSPIALVTTTVVQVPTSSPGPFAGIVSTVALLNGFLGNLYAANREAADQKAIRVGNAFAGLTASRQDLVEDLAKRIAEK